MHAGMLLPDNYLLYSSTVWSVRCGAWVQMVTGGRDTLSDTPVILSCLDAGDIVLIEQGQQGACARHFQPCSRAPRLTARTPLRPCGGRQSRLPLPRPAITANMAVIFWCRGVRTLTPLPTCVAMTRNSLRPGSGSKSPRSCCRQQCSQDIAIWRHTRRANGWTGYHGSLLVACDCPHDTCEVAEDRRL